MQLYWLTIIRTDIQDIADYIGDSLGIIAAGRKN
jgi:quinolinate synthase